MSRVLGSEVPDVAVTDAASLRDASWLNTGVLLIWLATAVGVLHPIYRSIGIHYLELLGLGPIWMYLACAFELGLAVWMLSQKPSAWMTALQFSMVVFFTTVLLWADPMLAAHPLGVLSKNAPILAAIFGAWGLRHKPTRELARLGLWLGVAFVWVNEGLMPKILFQSGLELNWIDQVGVSRFAPAPLLLGLLGLLEIAFGLALIAPGIPLAWRRRVLGIQFWLMLLLPIPVALFSPMFLFHPFAPLWKNLPLLAATMVLYSWAGRGIAPWSSKLWFKVPATGPSEFSRLSSDGERVGHDFFDRFRLSSGPAAGLLEDFSTLTSTRFDSAQVSRHLVAFYEKTASYDMTASAQWGRLFRPLAGLWRRFYAVPVGQFALPHDNESDGLSAQIQTLKPGRDGRDGVRAWTRSTTDVSPVRTVYTAAYAAMILQGEPVMSVAFPQPFGNVTTVLQPQIWEGDGLELSTFVEGTPAGAYLVLLGSKGGGLAVKFPVLQEQLQFSAELDGTMVATHHLWLLGLRFVTMTYEVKLRG